MPLLIVACAVAVLIFLIVKVKLNTFVSLIITAFLTALVLQIPVDKIPSTIETGIGGQLGHLAIIFGFGSMLGKLVSDSGGGHRIAMTLINRFGRKHIQIAVVVASFIVGIALFFEVGLVVLLPIIFVIARELDMPLMFLGIPMAITLNVAHAFLPPHPAPTAITETLGANMGHVLLFGIIVSIPTVIVAGPLFNMLLHRIKPGLYRKNFDIAVLGEFKEFSEDETPGFGISVLTSMMPVLLIAVATVCSFTLPKDALVNEVIQAIGAPDTAMLLSMLFAVWSMGFARGKKMPEIAQSMTESVKQIAMMLLIIGGGGAFKQVLVDGGISDYVSTLFQNINMPPLIAAWLVAAVLRVCLGSATVASLTAAGLVAPLMTMTTVNPALMVLAVGAGSVIADHVNDAGFWMIKEYFGLSLKETFMSWTTATTVMSVMGLVSVLGLSLFV
ncbi:MULTISPECIES: gluconate:H+ symporter [Bifidobacterium]|uniref:Gluconate permease n=1 Tax=Bifidobacterium aerophilum TaxID=1798155 RepID=A0A6N9Z5V1_9BIFI|nr:MULTISPECIES: gluconate:H+ symporter [Bifidobacterium]MBT1160367.1 gluconate permease [Bifidobacterium sp. SO1]MBW3079228.1 gluconate:H+ symporter [Bifidobacterium simiiventris]NEG89988.1 gluconate permease [Bifidobacterium aerophilum]